ncbi:MAG: hypothetical protein OEY86_15170 [Nitrospira sp.]|nr:hypothetical protein [Nitrospira sp.]
MTLTIRTELLRRGFNMSDIARRCQVTPSAVSRVVAGLARSRKIESCICQVIGIRRRDLFPMKSHRVSHKLSAA